MSWWDSVVDFGKSVIGGVGDFLGSNSLGSNLAKTALLGYATNKINKSINTDNAANTDFGFPEIEDPGIRLQVDPGTDNKIPVLYGSATFGGYITDAYLTEDNKTMYYAITLCEKTGNLLSTGSASTYVFNDIYLNGNRVIFDSDGITADYMITADGEQDISIRDIIRVYCYAGSSTSGQVPEYYSGSVTAAYNVMPNWTTRHTMNDLIFAVVRIDYNRDKGVIGVPNMKFTITNSMSLPGDCMYDYMTNTRYGAGIDATEIDS